MTDTYIAGAIICLYLAPKLDPGKLEGYLTKPQVPGTEPVMEKVLRPEADLGETPAKG